MDTAPADDDDAPVIPRRDHVWESPFSDPREVNEAADHVVFAHQYSERRRNVALAIGVVMVLWLAQTVVGFVGLRGADIDEGTKASLSLAVYVGFFAKVVVVVILGAATWRWANRPVN